jgi:hypothetical protein
MVVPYAMLGAFTAVALGCTEGGAVSLTHYASAATIAEANVGCWKRQLYETKRCNVSDLAFHPFPVSRGSVYVEVVDEGRRSSRLRAGVGKTRVNALGNHRYAKR